MKSPKVATYDLKPEMSAPEVGMDLVEAIKSDKYDVIIINFANPDMVGHTGVIPAARNSPNVFLMDSFSNAIILFGIVSS